MTLSVKAGVTFEIDSLALSRMLTVLLLLPYDGDVVITSGTDGTHMPTSKHYTGEALDLRTSNMTDPVAFGVQLGKALGPSFRVLNEKDHLHVQVRKGHTYP